MGEELWTDACTAWMQIIPTSAHLKPPLPSISRPRTFFLLLSGRLQHPNVRSLTSINSFMSRTIDPYGVNNTVVLWGKPTYNTVLLPAGNGNGNVQSEILFEKGDDFTLQNGWPFPQVSITRRYYTKNILVRVVATHRFLTKRVSLFFFVFFSLFFFIPVSTCFIPAESAVQWRGVYYASLLPRCSQEGNNNSSIHSIFTVRLTHPLLGIDVMLKLSLK